MTQTIKEFIIDCVEQARGDDFYRSQCAFQNCTPLEMDEQYGASGGTRQEIKDGYKAHEIRCDVAIKIINEKV